MRSVLPLTTTAALLSFGLSTSAGAISTPTTIPAPISTPVATSPAVKLLAAADHDAESQKWVHEYTTANETGIASTTSTAVLGTQTLAGSITTSGILGSGTFSVIDLIKTNREYLKGTAGGLGAFDHLVFTAATEPEYVGKWIKLSAASEEYMDIGGETLSEEFKSLTLAVPATLSTSRYDGQKVRAIHETSGGVDETIYVSDSATPLPVGYLVTTSGVYDSTTWSDWGHGTISVAPVGALAFPVAASSSTTSTTTPTSAAFCSGVTTLDTAYTTFVSSGSGTATTLAEYITLLDTLTPEANGLVTDLESVITAAPTPAIGEDYTVLLGYAKAFVVTLGLINAALAQLPAGSSQTAIGNALGSFEIRLILDASAILYTGPTNKAAQSFCPGSSTTTSTTTTTTLA